jgi:hypothetical protein
VNQRLKVIQIESLILRAVESIPDKETRRITQALVNTAPLYFWTRPSSSTGKYHPVDENTEGGLALHTLRVFGAAKVMLESRVKDSPGWKALVSPVLSASLLHDIRRYGPKGKPSQWSVKEHPDLAASLAEQSGLDQTVVRCIKCHMGPWGTSPPVAEAEWMVHLADNIATHLDDLRFNYLRQTSGPSRLFSTREGQ